MIVGNGGFTNPNKRDDGDSTCRHDAEMPDIFVVPGK